MQHSEYVNKEAPQLNYLDPKCTVDSLILYILQQTSLTACQFGSGNFVELSGIYGFLV